MDETRRLLKSDSSDAVDSHQSIGSPSDQTRDPEVESAKFQNRWFPQASVPFVCIAAFLYTFSSVGEPVRNIIMFKLACNTISLENADGVCDSKDVQIFMSNYSQWSLLISQLASIFALANIGNLSERFGRKPFMLMIVVCVFAARSITFVAFKTHDTFQFYTFLFSDFTQSVLGGLFGYQGLVNSYIADVAHPNKRVFLMGFGIGAIFAGETLGPMLSRFLLRAPSKMSINETKTFAPITALEFVPLQFELAIGFILIVYIAFVLPESKTEKDNQPQGALLKPLNYMNILKPIQTLWLPAEYVSPQYVNKKYRIRLMVFILVVCSVISSIFSIGVGRIIIQYGIYLFKWKSKDIANLMSLLAFSRCVVLFAISPFISHTVLAKYFKLEIKENELDLVDLAMILLGAFFDIFFYLGIAAANNTPELFASLIAGCLGAILSPTAQSALIKYFPKSKTSEVLLGISLINGLGCIVAPVVSMSIYRFGLRHGHPGMIFGLASLAFTCLVALIIVGKRCLRVTN